MNNSFAHIPPPGVRINTNILPRKKRIRARARWTDPNSGVRRSRSTTVNSEAAADEFFGVLIARAGTDLEPLIRLNDYVDQIGDRFLGGVDMTSTASGYRAALGFKPCLPSDICAFETSQPV